MQWIDTYRGELGIMTLVIQGESGGGKLVLVTAIKANREGWIGAIGGVYASVPYIGGVDTDTPGPGTASWSSSRVWSRTTATSPRRRP